MIGMATTFLAALLGFSDVEVLRTSGENEEPVRFNVVAMQVPVVQVLEELARQTGRRLSIEPGEASVRCSEPMRAHLRDRPLSICIQRIADVMGISIKIRRQEIRAVAAEVEVQTGATLLQNALRRYRTALIEDPTHREVPRIRFEIANILYQLGDYEHAIQAFEVLQGQHDGFPDLALAYFRAGHAAVRLGNDQQAIEQWLSLVHKFPGSPLVASAYLASVRAFRRQERWEDADSSLRSVVERVTGPMPPSIIVEAADLMREGGDLARAVTAYDKALKNRPTPEVEQKALKGLALSYAALEDWPKVILTGEQSLSADPTNPYAADLYYLEAKAHLSLGAPFVALQALHQSRILAQQDDLRSLCDLEEGRVYARLGEDEFAVQYLSRAGHAKAAETAGEALLLLGDHYLRKGRPESARESFESITNQVELEPYHLRARSGLARAALDAFQWQRCLDMVRELLPEVSDPSMRLTLVEIAEQAFRHQRPPGPEEGEPE